MPTTIGIGGLSPSPEKSFGRSRWAVPIPPSAARKSRCHQSRRNSPSVTAGSPTASSLAHEVGDRLVLDRLQLVGVEVALAPRGAGVAEPLRSQHAADHVGVVG